MNLTNTFLLQADHIDVGYKEIKKIITSQGRIANALDIAKLRVKYGFKHWIWTHKITTSSTEWLGLDHYNNFVFVILHQKSPIENSVALKHYDLERDSPGRSNKISRRLFVDVLEAKHGPVTVVNVKDVLSNFNHIKHESKYATMNEILDCPLFLARIGSDYHIKMEYLHLHREAALHDTQQVWEQHGTHGVIPNEFIRNDISHYSYNGLKYLFDKHSYMIGLNSAGFDFGEYSLAHFIEFDRVVFLDNRYVTSVHLNSPTQHVQFMGIKDKSAPLLDTIPIRIIK